MLIKRPCLLSQFSVPPAAPRLTLHTQHCRGLWGDLVAPVQGLHSEKYLPWGTDSGPTDSVSCTPLVPHTVPRRQPTAQCQDQGYNQPAQQNHLQTDPQVRGGAGRRTQPISVKLSVKRGQHRNTSVFYWTMSEQAESITFSRLWQRLVEAFYIGCDQLTLLPLTNLNQY